MLYGFSCISYWQVQKESNWLALLHSCKYDRRVSHSFHIYAQKTLANYTYLETEKHQLALNVVVTKSGHWKVSGSKKTCFCNPIEHRRVQGKGHQETFSHKHAQGRKSPTTVFQLALRNISAKQLIIQESATKVCYELSHK